MNKVDDKNPPLDPPAIPSTPPAKPSVPQNGSNGGDKEDDNEDNEEDASIWSGPSWWSWGPSVVSDHDYARDVWHVPEVYGSEYSGGRSPPSGDNDVDILDDQMTLIDYEVLVTYYKNGGQ